MFSVWLKGTYNYPCITLYCSQLCILAIYVNVIANENEGKNLAAYEKEAHNLTAFQHFRMNHQIWSSESFVFHFLQLLHRIVDGICHRSKPSYQEYSKVWNLQEWWSVADAYTDVFKLAVKESWTKDQVSLFFLHLRIYSCLFRHMHFLEWKL